MKGLIRALCLGSAMMLFVSSVAQTIATQRLADSHSYDDASRLTGITYPSTATNSFGYNAFGARVSKTDSGGSFTFARAGASSGSAILSDGSAAYTPGISERRSSVSRFYHFGAQGENGRETASNESTASSRTWDAWGNPLSATGSTNSPFGAFGGTGSETEGDSGLIYSGEGAFYDPSIGRFIMSVSRSSPGGGYASFGDGGSNNPVSASGGPVAAPLVPAADGGGYVVGPSPASKPYRMLDAPGRGGYAGGSTGEALRRAGSAALDAVIDNPITPIPAIGAIGKAGKAYKRLSKSAEALADVSRARHSSKPSRTLLDLPIEGKYLDKLLKTPPNDIGHRFTQAVDAMVDLTEGVAIASRKRGARGYLLKGRYRGKDVFFEYVVAEVEGQLQIVHRVMVSKPTDSFKLLTPLN